MKVIKPQPQYVKCLRHSVSGNLVQQLMGQCTNHKHMCTIFSMPLPIHTMIGISRVDMYMYM